MNKFPEDLVPIGKIVKPHGISGEIKVFLYNKKSATLVKGINVWFENKKIFENYILDSIRGHSKYLIIKFKNINNIDQASFLKDKIFFISRDDFPSLDSNSFYLNDFIGFEIIDIKNKKYGVVIDVMNFPANDVLLVEYNKKEIMIPIVDDFVELFDINNNIIRVKNIKSLVEL